MVGTESVAGVETGSVATAISESFANVVKI
jgi:hypothetical protein